MDHIGRTSTKLKSVRWRIYLITVFVIYCSLHCSGQTSSQDVETVKQDTDHARVYDKLIQILFPNNFDACHHHIHIFLDVDASGSMNGPRHQTFSDAWTYLAHTLFREGDKFNVSRFADKSEPFGKTPQELKADNLGAIASLPDVGTITSPHGGTLYRKPLNDLRQATQGLKNADDLIISLLVTDGVNQDGPVKDDSKDINPESQPEYEKEQVDLTGGKDTLYFRFLYLGGNGTPISNLHRMRYTPTAFKKDDSTNDNGSEVDLPPKSPPLTQRAVPAAACILLGTACLIALVVHRRLWRKHHLKFHFNVKFPRNLAVSDRDEWEVNLRDGEVATICAVSDLQRPGEKQLPLKLDDRENGIRDIIRISTFPAMGLFRISSWKIEKLHPTDDKRSRQVILKRTVLTNDGIQQDEPVANEEKIDFAEQSIVRHYKVGFDEDNLQTIAIKQGDAPWHDKHYPNFKRTSILLAALGLGLLLMGPVVWAALAPPQPKIVFEPLSKIHNGSETKNQPPTAPLCSEH